MKKLLCVLVSLALCLSLLACGDDSTDPAANSDTTGGSNSGVAQATKPVADEPINPGATIPTLDTELRGTWGDNITYVLGTDGTLTISGEGNMSHFDYDDGAANTPWYEVRKCIKRAVIEEGITGISPHTFYNCSNMEAVTIPSTVDEIGSVAFCGCNALKEITIPEGVTRLGNSTFGGCVSLTKITLPESLESIAQNAFSGSGLTSIRIPDSVGFIGSSVFSGCTSLTEVILPANLDEILGYCFSGCEKLEQIVIPEGVTSIENKAFRNCTALKEITIPASVTDFGADIFQNCENLTIIGAAGSAAETYAQSNGIAFQAEQLALSMHISNAP